MKFSAHGRAGREARRHLKFQVFGAVLFQLFNVAVAVKGRSSLPHAEQNSDPAARKFV